MILWKTPGKMQIKKTIKKRNEKKKKNEEQKNKKQIQDIPANKNAYFDFLMNIEEILVFRRRRKTAKEITKNIQNAVKEYIYIKRNKERHSAYL